MSSKKTADKRRSQKIAKEKAKALRPYLSKLKSVDLRRNLTPAQKGYITKAFAEYELLTRRPVKVYKPKSKEKLKTAQKISQHGNVKFDVAFVPTAAKDAKIKIKKDRLIIQSKYVDEIQIEFNMLALARDPAKEIKRVIDANPEFQSFVLMAGESIWNGPIHRDLAVMKMAQLMERYADGGAKLKSDRSNHYTKWAVGVRAFKSKNQRDIHSHVAEFKKANKAILEKRAKQRKANRQKAYREKMKRL